MKNLKPTETELEVLQILWHYGPSTVRFVNEKINQKKKTGYTTTLKIMQLMMEKGMLDRDEKSRSHIYHTLLNEQETKGFLLDRVLENVFGGSAKKMVMQALGNNKTSRIELEEIKKYIEKLEGGEK